MCQKSLNFTYAFKCYQQNVSGFTLDGPPCISNCQAVRHRRRRASSSTWVWSRRVRAQQWVNCGMIDAWVSVVGRACAADGAAVASTVSSAGRSRDWPLSTTIYVHTHRTFSQIMEKAGNNTYHPPPSNQLRHCLAVNELRPTQTTPKVHPVFLLTKLSVQKLRQNPQTTFRLLTNKQIISIEQSPR